MLTKSKQFLDLLKTEFKNKDEYIGGERNIQKTIINDCGKIVLSVYRSNQSSIHYNYKIDMTAIISDLNVQILIKTGTSTSIGDPYCGRGMSNTPKEHKFTKSINEFKTAEEIVEYISSTFYTYYFRIESRN